MQPLEILAFRIGHQQRMIDPGAEALDRPRIAPGIEHGPGDDLLKEIDIDCARAGEGKKVPALAQQPQTVQIDVLVGAGGTIHMVVARSKLGGIQNDEVKGFALFP